MTYVISCPFEVRRNLSESDPDVRSVSRLPGFVRMEPVSGHAGRYELSFEVEAGSSRDARDAAEELVVEYMSALAAYDPRRLADVTPLAR